MKTITFDAREMGEGPAMFEQYQVIVADPPWFYNDQKKERKDTKEPTAGIGACHHYEQMKTPEICDMPVDKVTDPSSCLLFLWACCPLLPDAMQVLSAWGFEWVSIAFVWVKMNKTRWEDAQNTAAQRSMFSVDEQRTRAFLDALTWFGPGYYTGSNVELVLLGRKGKPPAHAQGCKASQVLYAKDSIRKHLKEKEEPQIIYAPHGARHSEKPEMIQDAIERMYPQALPRLELFGRRPRRGWTVAGNEV